MFIGMLACTSITLCRYVLGPLALLDLMVSFMPTSKKVGALGPFAVSQLLLVVLSVLSLTPLECSIAVGTALSRVMRSGLPTTTRVC